jgi:hypothetical protein
VIHRADVRMSACRACGGIAVEISGHCAAAAPRLSPQRIHLSRGPTADPPLAGGTLKANQFLS